MDCGAHCITSTLMAFGLTYVTLCLGYGPLLSLMLMIPPIYIYGKFSLENFKINKARADSVGIEWFNNTSKAKGEGKRWEESEAPYITMVYMVFGVIFAFGFLQIFEIGGTAILDKRYNPVIIYAMN